MQTNKTKHSILKMLINLYKKVHTAQYSTGVTMDTWGVVQVAFRTDKGSFQSLESSDKLEMCSRKLAKGVQAKTVSRQETIDRK